MSRRFTRLIVLAVLIASTPFLTAQATLVVGPDTLHSGVGRFGINLSGQNYYDSGQLSRNLVVRNPGFEAGTWRSILHCKATTATTCTDVNPYTVWPANFRRLQHRGQPAGWGHAHARRPAASLATRRFPARPDQQTRRAGGWLVAFAVRFRHHLS